MLSFAPAGARGIERPVPRAYARGQILPRLRRYDAGEKSGLVFVPLVNQILDLQSAKPVTLLDFQNVGDGFGGGFW